MNPLETTIINELPSKLNIFSEGIILRPLLLFSDKVFSITPSSTFMNDYRRREKWTDKYYMAMYKSYAMEEKGGIPLKEIEDLNNKLNHIKRQKYKSKEMIVIQQQGKRLFDKLKEVVEGWHEHYLTNFNTLELQPFIERKIFNAWPCYGICQPKDEEDLHIKAIATVILKDPDILVFDYLIEELMPFITITNGALQQDAPKNEAEFIKAPLFEFPPLHGLSYEQMDYTRNNLKESFRPFKQQIEAFEAFLKPITFEKKNQEQIAAWFSTHIFPLLETIQKDINNDLYIQQAIQSNPPSANIKVLLGITSLKGMVDYYEKSEITKPYVADTIRRNMEREADISTSGLFFYHQLVSKKDNKKDFV